MAPGLGAPHPAGVVGRDRRSRTVIDKEGRMSDAARIAAVGVRFIAAYTLVHAVLGLVGVVGLARVNTGLGAVGAAAALILALLGGLLWVGAPTFGALISRGLD